MAANKTYSRHREFYGGSVTFLVEDFLFKVPREPFQTGSTVFRDMFLLPQGETVEGLNDERPIKLDGIAMDEFEQLLRVLLYRNYGTSPRLPAGVAQWTSVLKLSTLWEFDELRKAAIDALSTALCNDPIDRVILSSRFGITAWLLPALNELAQRPESLSVGEANRLGIETALMVASVREHIKLELFEEALTCNCHNRRHTYTSKQLVVGPGDPGTRVLDFTPLLCTKLNL